MLLADEVESAPKPAANTQAWLLWAYLLHPFPPAVIGPTATTPSLDDTDSVPEDSEFIRFQPSRNEKRQLTFNSGC